uniref:Leucine zipper transcription factor-like protein 1 n=1 Tax=Strombidium rassoulzadegani TaxID=1082188 RepID=A0A7S3CMM1_9SPIT|mmetsp:Transcript_17460/g.29383  ORF Transcript_17460/g.29383 Transcript_17460/m.29383 type:complete len:128 (+) Transcript_17460:481-864(+)
MMQKQFQNQQKNMQQSSQTLANENDSLKKQISDLQANLDKMTLERAKGSGSSKQLEMQIVELENKVMMLEEEKRQEKEANLQNKEELNKKVNNLTQVNNMKKMIMDKNSHIKTLRDRLSKYENLDED